MLELWKLHSLKSLKLLKKKTKNKRTKKKIEKHYAMIKSPQMGEVTLFSPLKFSSVFWSRTQSRLYLRFYPYTKKQSM